MIRKLPALVLALCLTALLAQSASAAGASAHLEPYYAENYAPGGVQTWYLANTNEHRQIRATVAEMHGNVRIRNLIITVDPGQSMYVGTRQPNDNVGWEIVNAHYTSVFYR